jgi:hypothetical protein
MPVTAGLTKRGPDCRETPANRDTPIRLRVRPGMPQDGRPRSAAVGESLLSPWRLPKAQPIGELSPFPLCLLCLCVSKIRPGHHLSRGSNQGSDAQPAQKGQPLASFHSNAEIRGIGFQPVIPHPNLPKHDRLEAYPTKNSQPRGGEEVGTGSFVWRGNPRSSEAIVGSRDSLANRFTRDAGFRGGLSGVPPRVAPAVTCVADWVARSSALRAPSPPQ